MKKFFINLFNISKWLEDGILIDNPVRACFFREQQPFNGYNCSFIRNNKIGARMTQKIKSVNKMGPKELTQFFHQDGVFDIIAGAVLLNFGLDVVNQNPVTSLFAYLPIILYNSIKKQVFFARIDLEELGFEEKKVRMWSLYLLIGTILFMVAMGILVLSDTVGSIALPAWLPDGDIHSLTAGVITALASTVAALFIPLKRFWVYALTALILGVVSFFFMPAYVPIFASAVAMLGWGIWLMIKFRRAYPPKEEEGNK